MPWLIMYWSNWSLLLAGSACAVLAQAMPAATTADTNTALNMLSSSVRLPRRAVAWVQRRVTARAVHIPRRDVALRDTLHGQSAVRHRNANDVARRAAAGVRHRSGKHRGCNQDGGCRDQ